MNIPEQYIYELEAAMEQWTDARVISSTDLENLLLFLLYLPKIFSQLSIKIQGFSSRRKNGRNLLTIKSVEGDTPLVAFVTSDTTIGCMVRFLDLLESDRLNWVKDRYPWI